MRQRIIGVSQLTRSVPAGVIGAEECLGVLVTSHLPGRFAFVWQSGNGSSLYVYTSVHTCNFSTL